MFPAYYVFFIQKEKWDLLLKIFTASILWLSIKTLLLEYIFSHKIYYLFEPIYKWIRTSGVGEITVMESGFVRIFFQSHIYILFGFFILLLFFIIWYSWRQSKKDIINEQKRNKAIKEAVREGMKEAIIELKEEGKL